MLIRLKEVMIVTMVQYLIQIKLLVLSLNNFLMALKNFAFKVLDKDKFARCGIETHRGNINTPAFMPVGTQATVKACTIDDIKKLVLK